MSVAFLRNVPVEILEAEAPVVVHRFALRPDSEGPGRFRGGFGIEYELEIRHPSAVVVMRGKDRHRFTSWGAAGGGAGTTNGCIGTRRGESAARHRQAHCLPRRDGRGDPGMGWRRGRLRRSVRTGPRRRRRRCRGRPRLAGAGGERLRRGAHRRRRRRSGDRGVARGARSPARSRFRLRRRAQRVGARAWRGRRADRALAAATAAGRAALCPGGGLPQPCTRSARAPTALRRSRRRSPGSAPLSAGRRSRCARRPSDDPPRGRRRRRGGVRAGGGFRHLVPAGARGVHGFVRRTRRRPGGMARRRRGDRRDRRRIASASTIRPSTPTAGWPGSRRSRCGRMRAGAESGRS